MQRKVGLGSNIYLLMTAQFVSGLADNALLLIAIALHIEQGGEGWWIPLIKFSFTTFYVLTAPISGIVADRWPKQWVMLAANGIKGLGCMGMLLGMPVIPAMMLVGLGAALYSPAKYGLITELVQPKQLVKANGWIEISTVGAAIIGIMLGGFLISELFIQAIASQYVKLSWFSASNLSASLGFLVLCYVLALALNIPIRGSQIIHHRPLNHPRLMLQSLWKHQGLMWRDPEAGMSLGVTTLSGGSVQPCSCWCSIGRKHTWG